MAYKDPERKNYFKECYRKKHPNVKRRDAYYDFETHRELAMNSGINGSREWHECYKMGLFPDGIYHSPDDVFKRKGPLKNNNTP